MRSTIAKLALSTVFGMTLGLGLGSVTPAPPTNLHQLQNPPNPNNCEAFDCCGLKTKVCISTSASASSFTYGADVPAWKPDAGGPFYNKDCTTVYYGNGKCTGPGAEVLIKVNRCCRNPLAQE